MSEKIMVNGKQIYIKSSRSTFTKTAYVMSQEILHNLNKIGITREYIDLNLPRNPFSRETPAEIGWRVNEQELYFQCNTQERYVDNLGVISKVIAQESYAIRNGLKSYGQVMNQFKIGYEEGVPKIKSPREVLGLANDMKDVDFIDYKYKILAKKYHPDTEEGNAEKFKEINQAYEDIKKERNFQ